MVIDLIWEQEVPSSNLGAPTKFNSNSLYYPLITLYILKGETGKRYVGITNNFSRRPNEHRSRHSKAGQLLGRFTVLHTENYTDYNSARLREKFLKSGQGRKWLDEFEVQSEPARGGYSPQASKKQFP
ncbi:MAG: GIY-YIG nuclease family protein [Desulfobacterales bacterium]|jgi:predicted GIY-YIG superfamily endonuclease